MIAISEAGSRVATAPADYTIFMNQLLLTWTWREEKSRTQAPMTQSCPYFGAFGGDLPHCTDTLCPGLWPHRRQVKGWPRRNLPRKGPSHGEVKRASEPPILINQGSALSSVICPVSPRPAGRPHPVLSARRSIRVGSPCRSMTYSDRSAGDIADSSRRHSASRARSHAG
jgi:hypothetical protein